eukprot:TRINITY_DN3341_c0_g1_i7.p3 TRINITY_DN3341_c0_g1~~TRINITY_DN3341_c0_g1_i7.p3  ORF type:complete len:285 (+),score=14.75 TRINITY_DN3341_c0_g1_i7:74-856(+)
MPLPIEEWRSYQRQMRDNVILHDDFEWSLDQEPKLKYVGGVDISTEKHGRTGAEHAVAALVVLSFPELEVVYEDYQDVDLTIPYKATYLGFRECDAYGKLVGRVANSQYNPQIILVDGFGLLHPRRAGCASHLGVETGCVTIGVAKNLLHTDGLEHNRVMAQTKRILRNRRNNAFDRTASSQNQGNNRPSSSAQSNSSGSRSNFYKQQLSASIRDGVYEGHRVSLETALEIVRRCCLYRIPEPIRQADKRSRKEVSKRGY